jgi:antitoxin ParD1/3/4
LERKSFSAIFEFRQTKKDELIKDLKQGEESGFTKNIARTGFLENLHKKHPPKS